MMTSPRSPGRRGRINQAEWAVAMARILPLPRRLGICSLCAAQECLPPGVKGCRGAEKEAATPPGVRRKSEHLWGLLQSRVFLGACLMGWPLLLLLCRTEAALLNSPWLGSISGPGSCGQPDSPPKESSTSPWPNHLGSYLSLESCPTSTLLSFLSFLSL